MLHGNEYHELYTGKRKKLNIAMYHIGCEVHTIRHGEFKLLMDEVPHLKTWDNSHQPDTGEEAARMMDSCPDRVTWQLLEQIRELCKTKTPVAIFDDAWEV